MSIDWGEQLGKFFGTLEAVRQKRAQDAFTNAMRALQIYQTTDPYGQRDPNRLRALMGNSQQPSSSVFPVGNALFSTQPTATPPIATPFGGTAYVTSPEGGGAGGGGGMTPGGGGGGGGAWAGPGFEGSVPGTAA